MRLRPVTQSKLEHGTRALLSEFTYLPRDEVVREVETVARNLLEGARFDDFIPVLAQRFARDHLRDRPVRDVFVDAA